MDEFYCRMEHCGDTWHTPECYDLRNQQMLRRQMESYVPGSAIWVKCFNEAEAQKVKEFLTANYPDTPFTVAWLAAQRKDQQ